MFISRTNKSNHAPAPEVRGQKGKWKMAKATAIYKCPDCGATIERRIDGFNRRDADSKKEWAEAHPLLCADCYRKQQLKQQREAAAALSLPIIHGRERQTSRIRHRGEGHHRYAYSPLRRSAKRETRYGALRDPVKYLNLDGVIHCDED